MLVMVDEPSSGLGVTINLHRQQFHRQAGSLEKRTTCSECDGVSHLVGLDLKHDLLLARRNQLCLQCRAGGLAQMQHGEVVGIRLG